VAARRAGDLLPQTLLEVTVVVDFGDEVDVSGTAQLLEHAHLLQPGRRE
jgi:hypothetical protein